MLTYNMIKTLCKEKGVTVTDTEHTLGFSRGSLCKIDTSKPSMEKVQKLSAYFHIPVENLIASLNDNMNNADSTRNYMYEIFESLCNEKNVTPYHVCKNTGITTATISNWKAGRYIPKIDKIQKIADYFEVNIEYLMTGQRIENPIIKSKLTKCDEHDIEKIINATIQKLMNQEGLTIDNLPVSTETIESIIFAMRIITEMVKEKARKDKKD